MPDIFATEDVDLKKLLNPEDRDLIGRMKSILGPFILRRLKSDVMQQLVPKIQQVCGRVPEIKRTLLLFVFAGTPSLLLIFDVYISATYEDDLNSGIGKIKKKENKDRTSRYSWLCKFPCLKSPKPY